MGVSDGVGSSYAIGLIGVRRHARVAQGLCGESLDPGGDVPSAVDCAWQRH
jgi:hypothetical protein